MKKIIGTIVLTLGIISSAQSDVTPKNQAGIKLVLDDIGLKSVWAQNISLWIQNPGWSKSEMETFGNQVCTHTNKYNLGSYTVTFWQSISGPRGKITKVRCY